VIYLAPDTNVLLHYTLFTEIDWPAVAEPSDITLLFPATIIHELDARKYTGSDQRLQNRAQTVLRRSRSIIGSRSATALVSPKVRFTSYSRNVHPRLQRQHNAIPHQRQPEK